MYALATNLFGQTAALPKRLQPVREKVKRESKADQAWAKSKSRLAWMVAPASADETWFRHHNWQARRDLVRRALVNTYAGEFAIDRFDQCGGECLVEYSESEKRYRLRANYCKCRHCAPCQRAKATTLSGNLKARLEQQPAGNDRYRFLTFTLQHKKDDPLAPMLKQLYASFTALRQTKLWKKSQKGGATIMEIKWSESGGWHPHLHVAAEGDWIKQEHLKREWQRITDGSYKVDIRKLDDAKSTAFYVAKYISKGTNDEVWLNDAAATEYVTAMKGVRTCATYGTWRGFKLLAIDRAHEADDWKPVGLLNQLVRRAADGEELATNMLISLVDAFQYDPHKKRHKCKIDKPPA